MLTSALVIAALIASAPPTQMQALSPAGFGRVKIGMTTRQAEQALGVKLNLTTDEDPSGQCLRGRRADGVDPGVVYMAVTGVIQRVDIELALEPAIRTPEGIGRDATPKQVKSIYGGRAKRDESDPNADPAANEDLVVDNADRKHGIQFKFEQGKLTWMIAGAYPALSFYEGCV